MTTNTLKCIFFFNLTAFDEILVQLQRNDFLAFQLTFFPDVEAFLGVPPSEYFMGTVESFLLQGFPFQTAVFVSFLWLPCCGEIVLTDEAAGQLVFEVLADRHYTDAHGRGDRAARVSTRHHTDITTEE